MGTDSKLRQPIELRQHDKRACEVCVVAQIEWVFGVSGKPNLKKLDKKLGRSPGKDTPVGNMFFYLQDRDFSIYEVVGGSHETFLQDTEGYLYTEYGKDWRHRFNSKQVRELRALSLEIIQRRQRAGRRWRVEQRNPTAQDISRLLQEGYVVSATDRYENGDGHAVLLCGLNYRNFTNTGQASVPMLTCYRPERKGKIKTVFEIDLEDLPEQIVLTEGIAGFRL